MKQINTENTTLKASSDKANTNIAAPVRGGVHYAGNITVSVQRGNKIISTKQYHNNGTALLFKFMANCLAGNYYYKSRPCRIRLFKNKENEDPTKAPIIEDGLEASALVYYDTTPKVFQNLDTENNNKPLDKYSVVFHFRIPYALINITPSTTETTGICKLALYNDDSAEIEDYLASFALTKLTEAGQRVFDILVFEETDFKQNYNLIIEWTMEISNQVEEPEQEVTQSTSTTESET